MTSHSSALRLSCALALAGLCATAYAGPAMTDPTRPPAGVVPAQPSGSGAAATPVVQSVIVTPHMRAAVIDGRRVEVGDKFGEARVVSITEREVGLQTGKRVEILRLYPQVEIRVDSNGGHPLKKPAAGTHGTRR